MQAFRRSGCSPWWTILGGGATFGATRRCPTGWLVAPGIAWGFAAVELACREVVRRRYGAFGRFATRKNRTSSCRLAHVGLPTWRDESRRTSDAVLSGRGPSRVTAQLRYEPEMRTAGHDFLDDLVSWRPPLPIDRFGDPAPEFLLDGADSEPGYAWQRLPYVLIDYPSETKREKHGGSPLIHVDLCSSVPLYIQWSRQRKFSRDGRLARQIVRRLFSQKERSRIPRDDRLHHAAGAVAADDRARALLCAAVQRSLYQLTHQEARRRPHGSGGQLRQRLSAVLIEQRQAYGERFTPDGPVTFASADGPDYFETVAALSMPHRSLGITAPIGEGRALALIAWQAGRIADEITLTLRERATRLLSMDVAAPDDIVASSIARASGDGDGRETFLRALGTLHDPRQHIVGDITDELPFPDASLVLVTCIDGWPFHASFRRAFAPAALNVIMPIHRKLRDGGELVICPPVPARTRDPEKALDSLTLELVRRVGWSSVSRSILHKETAHHWMSPADRDVATRHSPMLHGRSPTLDTLVITRWKGPPWDRMRRFD
jgi:SAM-dependent methyltransferase